VDRRCRLLPPPRPRTPTLVLSGSGDRLVAPECSVALEQHLGAVHHRHPTAGHELTLDDPAWVIARVQVWLDSSW